MNGHDFSVQFASTWKKRCGIAQRTEHLVDRLANKGISCSVDKFPTSVTSDVLHIQYEPYIYNESDVLDLDCDNKLVTLITTKPNEDEKLSEIDDKADRIVVPVKEAKNVLDTKMTSPVSHIPRGCTIFDTLSKEEIKKRAGLSNRPIAFMHGFGSQRKGIDGAIKALPIIKEEYPNFSLIITFSPHDNHGPRKDHYKEMAGIAVNLEVRKNVKFLRKFITEEQINKLVSMSDFLLFPYPPGDRPRLASSGAMHRVLAGGKPILTTASAYFNELNEGEHCVKVEDVIGLGEGAVRLLDDKSLSKKLGDNNRELAESMSWEKTADRYIREYEMMLDGN